MILTYENLQKSNFLYNKKEVYKNLIKIKKSTNHRVVDEAKLEVFLSLRTIVMKNIENFYILSKPYQEIIHTKDDLISECYIVLDNCISKLDLRKFSTFHWYYNKSLTWRMQRIIENTYYKYRGSVRVDEDLEEFVFSKMFSNSDVDLLDFQLNNFGITEEEKVLMLSKVNKVKIKDYIEENNGMTWNKYFKLFSSIKEKLKTLKDENIFN